MVAAEKSEWGVGCKARACGTICSGSLGMGWGFSTEAPHWDSNWLMGNYARAVAASGSPPEESQEAWQGVR